MPVTAVGGLAGGLEGSPTQLRRVFALCDPRGTGLVSVDHLASLASQYTNEKEDAADIIRTLDPKGRGHLTYKQFSIAVNSLLRQSGAGQATMMAPSVDRRDLAAGIATNNNNNSHNNNNSNGVVDDVTLSSSGPESNGKENSRCSSLSDGESYECFGEGDMDTSSPSSQPPSNDGAIRSPSSNSLRRNTWQRTSLRRTTPSNNHENLPNRRWGSFRQTSGKRLGSNALASQLYRSSSFNSSGRSSTCDTADDAVYSDVSLEDDVLDLNHKVQMLQQQMNVLADNQTHSDERYTRAKQDNAALQARIVMLEEQLREVELRSEEKLAEEERRHRELVARVDREKQLQVENCAIRLQTLELENNSLRDETGRWRNQLEKMRLDKSRVEDQLIEAEASVTSLRDEIAAVREQERKLREQAAASQILVEELSSEVERLQSEKANAEMLAELNRIPSSEPSPLQAQLEALRHQHKTLQEAHEELQALVITKSVEEGRHLLTNAGPNSLAAELQFEAMSQDAMRTALKEAQEVNTQLRSYIDGILLLIVDNCPRLLEIKTPPPPPAH
ncbi:rab11 family-interacting protein 3-like isoform X2 [Nilaparvata lugens]|uniref:rab11 family-interacting protein 3-like isoform X2 n=2 Tax=Nilaparvata lugens TaxID=108931 RepID=UPI00193D607C|nr:rab11 family-interacting protein 3-like isoform X2 [Nilaparvata lugens]